MVAFVVANTAAATASADGRRVTVDGEDKIEEELSPTLGFDCFWSLTRCFREGFNQDVMKLIRKILGEVSKT